MDTPEFVKCPGCGQENITTPGETTVHSKGCRFVGTLPETWKEQVVPASDPPAVVEKSKNEQPPALFLIVAGITLLCFGGLFGAMYGEEQGREEEKKNTAIYKELHDQCVEARASFQDAWVKQLGLTNTCLEALAAQGTEANMRAFRKAQALGIIPKDINPEDLVAPPHVNP